MRSRSRPKSKSKSKSSSTSKTDGTLPARTIDAYLARLQSEPRAALQKLRRAIRAAAPGAEECISYQMPAFRYQGRMLVWFGAGANHCALYPGAIPERFAAELAAYSTSKGTIRFQPSKPLPAALVRKLVKARIAAGATKRNTRAGAKSRA